MFFALIYVTPIFIIRKGKKKTHFYILMGCIFFTKQKTVTQFSIKIYLKPGEK